jgi:hypothetical protein
MHTSGRSTGVWGAFCIAATLHKISFGKRLLLTYYLQLHWYSTCRMHTMVVQNLKWLYALLHWNYSLPCSWLESCWTLRTLILHQCETWKWQLCWTWDQGHLEELVSSISVSSCLVYLIWLHPQMLVVTAPGFCAPFDSSKTFWMVLTDCSVVFMMWQWGKLSMIRGSQNLSPRTMERGIRFLVLISFYTFCKLFMVSENCIIIIWYFSSICVDTRISWSGVFFISLVEFSNRLCCIM